MDVAQLDRKPPADEEDRLLALLREVQGETPLLGTALIEQILVTTGSFRLRNATALTLVDLGASGSCERIGRLLGRPDVAPQSGTLLFALDELGGTLPVDSLVNIVRDGSYEGRAEALNFVASGRISATEPGARDRALDRLASIAAGPDTGAAEAAQEALALLSARPD